MLACGLGQKVMSSITGQGSSRIKTLWERSRPRDELMPQLNCSIKVHPIEPINSKVSRMPSSVKPLGCMHNDDGTYSVMRIRSMLIHASSDPLLIEVPWKSRERDQ